MTREEIDRALKAQAAENVRLAGALLEMDTHPGHQLLRDAALTGLTARRWSTASVEMAVLWAQFTAHRRLVEQAQRVRDRRIRPTPADLDEVARLLTTPVVELDADRLPVDGPGPVAETVGLTTLVDRMNASYAQVIDVLTAADRAWTAIAGHLDPLTMRLHEAEQLATVLGAHRNEVERIAGLVGQIRRTGLTDPLGTDATALTELDADLDAIIADLTELDRVRRGFDTRLERLAFRLTELASARGEAGQLAATVRTKIADPGLEPLPDDYTDLRLRLEELRATRRPGRWQQLAAAADELELATADALTAVRQHIDALNGLLERRSELRGRLDAFRAKARQLGHAEDLDLTALHKAARDALYVAPCDLAVATVAVNRYSEAVRERTGVPSSRRPADQKEPR
ncbi:hypothetical protein [Fodinicola acaciae]|uniref:hypothetical protein n=1 Tax=Fodinicola acaciae TaxID=2681555 RepID=UPI0013D88887|nr:hypothetical protein [Fodinicola acaciae]